MAIPSEVRTVRVGGQHLTLLAAGNAGPPLLLLHGFGSDRSSWRLNQAELAAGASTLALDLPAHGGSETDVGDGSIGWLSRQVELFLDGAGNGAAHIAGHSLGAAIAIDLASRRRDLVRSLFLISPAGLGQGIDPAFISRFADLEDVGETEKMLRGLVARPRLIGRQMAVAILQQLSRDGVRQGLRKIAAALPSARPALADAVHTIGAMTIPKHVVWGEGDLTNPIDEAYLARLHAGITIMKDAAHLPHMENAAEANRLMRRFLETGPPSG